MSNRPPRDRDEQLRQARAKLTAHRGQATWGARLVPLGDFRDAVAAGGRRLSAADRAAVVETFLARPDDGLEVEGLLIPTSTDPGDRVTLAGFRGHLTAQLPGRITLPSTVSRQFANSCRC